ncbi:M4 family metallopeptidase [Brasilonema octagenarum]|uniref:Neutral metalloproteinase n=1 Tax=Brasilonema octagenarum UFV-OR1 TaxID=417115 RepID=A0ABX1M3J6_9CYAN|nr:M4 family metallopeptidase [Brasilonema octagenarum]NMF62146.1 peptidase M4 family protein [Brasilonema octagenarum UFV-OR1]
MAQKKKKSVASQLEHQLHTRCPICCIIPPHMLEHVAVNGNEEQRKWAFRTLNVSAQFRGRRNVVGAVNFGVSPGQKRRTIYDAKNTEQLPGVLVRSEGDPPSQDPAVNEAYDAAGATYDLFKEIFERNSVDDKGLRLDSTVHYNVKYDNAFWNGDQMVYGDGDGEMFQSFTKCIDVIGHELTHGVTQHEAGLIYFGESGALNESFSDVFGSLVKQRVKNQAADQADWIIGEGLLTLKTKGVGIRSMKAPGTAYDDPVMGKDPQPAHMKNKYTGTDDNGGVHINSSIPNLAFYLAAMEIGGYAWEKAGKIWYISLRDRLKSKANFKQAANITIKVAEELYGQGSKEQKAVKNGWQKVGVL